MFNVCFGPKAFLYMVFGLFISLNVQEAPPLGVPTNGRGKEVTLLLLKVQNLYLGLRV